MERGGGGCWMIGGRQFPAGGSVRGGPEYCGVAGPAGVGGPGRGASGSASGRCQYASSSGTPLGALTFTDGTADG
jgi:hypothetical protein